MALKDKNKMRRLPDEPKAKTCKRCEQVKHISDFRLYSRYTKDAGQVSVRMNICKQCQAIQALERKSQKKEKEGAYDLRENDESRLFNPLITTAWIGG